MPIGVSLPGYGFAGLLRRCREEADLTQVELARTAGLSPTAVRDLEQGRTCRPTAGSISRLADALRLTGPEAAEFHRAARDPVTRPAGPDPVPAGESAARPAIRIEVLGTLQIQRGHGLPLLASPRQRALLGRLAISPGTVVSRAELIDVLWGEDPPRSAVNLVHTYVARLRRLLEPQRTASGVATVLRLVPGGYRLDLSEEQLDLRRFERLVREANQDSPAVTAATKLEQALELWRDDPVADVEALTAHPARMLLVARGTAEATRCADLLDELGEYDRLVRVLRPFGGRHPLDEQVHGRLALALGATGRQGEAYACYDGVVRRLADQLGVDPGPELRAYRERLLRQQWHRTRSSAARRSTPTPWQSPAPPADFTGREAERAELRRLLDDAGHTGRRALPVCVITGLPGVGKSALSAAAAAGVASLFPDGHLHADLRGSSARPARAAEVLRRFLRTLDVAESDLPEDEAGAGALLRSLLADRRVLILLDDARDAAQVRPLVPGSGPSRVLVASRNRLVDLEAARRLELAVLPTDDALAMLAAVAGTAGPERDAAARDLVRSCGRLPMALRIAGVLLARRPGCTTAALARRLADPDQALHVLRAGDLDLRAVLGSGMAGLSAPAARAFRLVAAAPLERITVAAAGALLDHPVAETEDLLGRLADVSLLTPLDGQHFQMHRLLRAYGRELAERHEPPAARSAALRRLVSWQRISGPKAA
ncbi:BTAD domain-containing putative transcriptional regulator [Micromonospora coerulea]|uniref:BTAD domain-containing putative transcriptional regulator n=1 Tax=Micromonospora coerulea TaxID=47856 RepID=UPI0019054928|nr:BTAD domain-containing putative transcriptional regulator [Micromonospora veneta]